jgi:hypothetical protein
MAQTPLTAGRILAGVSALVCIAGLSIVCRFVGLVDVWWAYTCCILGCALAGVLGTWWATSPDVKREMITLTVVLLIGATVGVVSVEVLPGGLA